MKEAEAGHRASEGGSCNSLDFYCPGESGLRRILKDSPRSLADVLDSSCHCNVWEQGTLTPLLSVGKNNRHSGGGTALRQEALGNSVLENRDFISGGSFILGRDAGACCPLKRVWGFLFQRGGIGPQHRGSMSVTEHMLGEYYSAPPFPTFLFLFIKSLAFSDFLSSLCCFLAAQATA